MALGTPSVGTGSIPSWFSQYETNFTNILQRLADNTSNQINAKDVRDAVWTLYNQILSSSGSSTQSFSYTLATPSTIDVGGISQGSTFSNIPIKDFLDSLLLPYVGPVVTLFSPSNLELEFGQTTPTSLNFSIDVGSSPLLGNITFVSPNPSTPLNPYPSTGSDPEVGTTTNNFTPTFSSVVSLTAENVATMSFTTTDLLVFSATTSLVFKHKIYYGSLDLTSLSLDYSAKSFWSGSASSIASVSSFINDAAILGLSYSNLSTDFQFSQEIYFATGSHFVFAYPTIFGDLPQKGLYVNDIFSNGFTKVRNGVTFSNLFSYDAPYDVWVSEYPLDDVSIKISTE
jgi:hypothetical protein